MDIFITNSHRHNSQKLTFVVKYFLGLYKTDVLTHSEQKHA
jgi:hypothetical protein